MALGIPIKRYVILKISCNAAIAFFMLIDLALLSYFTPRPDIGGESDTRSVS